MIFESETIAKALARAEERLKDAGVGAARLEAEVLLARRIGISRGGLISRFDAPLDAATEALFRSDVERRVGRYPLQYITGEQEFYSLGFAVDPRVLIPRPETEMIVDAVIRLAADPKQATVGGTSPDPAVPGATLVDRAADPATGGARESDTLPRTPTIIDVGTGSGCIAVTLAVHLPSARIWAIDCSEGALEVARGNAARHAVGERVRFVRGDGLRPVEAASADVVVSNPPYIPEAELTSAQPELAFEPRMALTPGRDGLQFIRELVADASRVLRTGGRLLVELGLGQAVEARRLLDPALWDRIEVLADMQGIERLLIARRVPR